MGSLKGRGNWYILVSHDSVLAALQWKATTNFLTHALGFEL